MKSPTPAQITACIERWRSMRSHVAKAEENILKMMRHPEVTREQLWEAHESYVRTTKSQQDIKKSLQKILPDQSFTRSYPWNQ